MEEKFENIFKNNKVKELLIKSFRKSDLDVVSEFLEKFGDIYDLSLTESNQFVTQAYQKIQEILLKIYVEDKLRVNNPSLDTNNDKTYLNNHSDYNISNVEQNRVKTIDDFHIDDILYGRVIKILPYAVLVDLGGIVGKINKDDLSYNYVYDPNEVVKYNQKIKVKVIGVNKHKQHIYLGIKQLNEESWNSKINDLAINQVVQCRIKSIVEYGAFVEIKPGVDGLIHRNNISTKEFNDLQKCVENKIIHAVIISINENDRKINLKLADNNIYQQNTSLDDKKPKYEIGDNVNCKIKSLDNKGLYVELNDLSNGFIPIDEVLCNHYIPVNEDIFQIGDELKAEVCDISESNGEYSLSMSRVQENVWRNIEKYFPVSRIQKGRVAKKLNRGFYVLFENYISGFILLTYKTSHLKVGDLISFKVKQYRKLSKSLILDIAEQDQKQYLIKEESKDLLPMWINWDTNFNYTFKRIKKFDLLGQVVDVSSSRNLAKDVHSLLYDLDSSVYNKETRYVSRTKEGLRCPFSLDSNLFIELYKNTNELIRVIKYIASLFDLDSDDLRFYVEKRR